MERKRECATAEYLWCTTVYQILYDKLYQILYDKLYQILYDKLYQILYDELYQILYDKLYQILYDKLYQILYDKLYQILYDKLYQIFDPYSVLTTGYIIMVALGSIIRWLIKDIICGLVKYTLSLPIIKIVSDFFWLIVVRQTHDWKYCKIMSKRVYIFISSFKFMDHTHEAYMRLTVFITYYNTYLYFYNTYLYFYNTYLYFYNTYLYFYNYQKI